MNRYSVRLKTHLCAESTLCGANKLPHNHESFSPRPSSLTLSRIATLLATKGGQFAIFLAGFVGGGWHAV